ncbi:MAG: phage protein GemA/Gp16 family protein [Desulfurivibrionaceae bacterium]
MAGLDRKKLAAIHIVKKELGLSDEEYRDILEEITGVRSARDLDEKGFRLLMNRFARSGYYQAGSDGITLRQKLYIKGLYADLGWDETHFRNFLNKYYGKKRPESLTKKEASKVIESLKNIHRHSTGKKNPENSRP